MAKKIKYDASAIGNDLDILCKKHKLEKCILVGNLQSLDGKNLQVLCAHILDSNGDDEKILCDALLKLFKFINIDIESFDTLNEILSILESKVKVINLYSMCNILCGHDRDESCKEECPGIKPCWKTKNRKIIK